MCLGIPMQVAVPSAWRGGGAGPSLAASLDPCVALRLEIGHA